jgi:Glyoxalase/Bleomycin resistance protein/Dioxygenase superfamily
MQVAYAAEELNTATKHWATILGVDPFFIIEHFPVADLRYRGKPAEVEVSLDLACSGNMCIELIKHTNSSRSVFHELLDSKGGGFHHWGIMSKVFEIEVTRHEQQGYKQAFTRKLNHKQT